MTMMTGAMYIIRNDSKRNGTSKYSLAENMYDVTYLGDDPFRCINSFKVHIRIFDVTLIVTLHIVYIDFWWEQDTKLEQHFCGKIYIYKRDHSQILISVLFTPILSDTDQLLKCRTLRYFFHIIMYTFIFSYIEGVARS